MHRVEVLVKGNTAEFEFWSNVDGSVYLCREGKQPWQAIVDGDVVTQEVEVMAAPYAQTNRALSAGDVRALADLLALQASLHVIFDHGEICARAEEEGA